MTNYTLINSIESNGQQYIDTGLTPSQVDKIEVRARSTVADRAILGCGTSNSSADRLQAYADVTYYSSRLDGTVVMSSVPNTSTITIVLDITNQKVTFNGTEVSCSYTGSFAERNIYLFARNTDGSDGSRYFSGKIYSCTMWKNGEVVRNYLPAKDANNSYCMYESVTNTLCYSGNGNAFLNTPTYSKELEYIVSDGNQLISTGVMTAEDIELEGEFALTVVDNTYRHFIGARVSDQSNAISQSFASVWQKLYWGFGNNSEDSSYAGTITAPQVYVWYHLLQNKDFFQINNDVYPYKSGYNTNFTTPLELVFLGRNNNGTKNATLKARVKYGIIRKAGVVVRHYIPVLDNNGVACFYDKVNDELKYSDNNVAFTHYRLIDTKDTNYGRLRELLISYNQPHYVPNKNRSAIFTDYMHTDGATSDAKVFYTNYYPTSNIEWEATVDIDVTQPDAEVVLFGTSNERIKLTYTSASQTIQTRYYNANSSSWSCLPNTKHTIKFIRETDGTYTHSLYIDGTRVQQFAFSASWTNNAPLVLMGYTNSSSVSSAGAFKLYNMKVWSNDGSRKILLHNYLSAIDHDGVYCLYDTEEEKYLYHRNSTGTLTVSSNRYKQVEYVNFTSTDTAIYSEFTNPRNGGTSAGQALDFQLDIVLEPTFTNTDKFRNLGGFSTANNSRFCVKYDGNDYQYQIPNGTWFVANGKKYMNYRRFVSNGLLTLAIDGEIQTSGMAGANGTGYGTWIFNYVNIGNSYRWEGKIYSYKITDYTHDVVYDYRPVINQSNTVGLYNIYTGMFIDCSSVAEAGPEKFVPKFQDYLQHGNSSYSFDTVYTLYNPVVRMFCKSYYSSRNFPNGVYVDANTGGMMTLETQMQQGTGTVATLIGNGGYSWIEFDGVSGNIYKSEVAQTGTFTTISSCPSFYIFGINNDPESSTYRQGFQGQVKLYSNGSLISNLIPCYDPNDMTKLTFYDTIHDTMLTSLSGLTTNGTGRYLA